MGRSIARRLESIVDVSVEAAPAITVTPLYPAPADALRKPASTGSRCDLSPGRDAAIERLQDCVAPADEEERGSGGDTRLQARNRGEFELWLIGLCSLTPAESGPHGAGNDPSVPRDGPLAKEEDEM